MSYYVDLAFNGLVFGCMYALMAVGLTLVYGLLRILHIAHAAVYAFGAYVAVIVANGTGSLAVGLLVAVVAASLEQDGPAIGVSIPTTLILDRSGGIAVRHAGFCSKAEYRHDIEKLLAE